MADSSPWCVVGLGNPGEKYCQHRHNVGFLFVHYLAKMFEVPTGWELKKKFQSSILQTNLNDGSKLILCKPQTFMNNSGFAASSLCQFYKIPASQVLVCHDELDLQFGSIKYKFSGGSAGHNGLKSMTQQLATPDYHRLRFGIGHSPKPPREAISNFVLSNFSLEERAELEALFDTASQAVIALLQGKLDSIHQILHNKPSP